MHFIDSFNFFLNSRHLLKGDGLYLNSSGGKLFASYISPCITNLFPPPRTSGVQTDGWYSTTWRGARSVLKWASIRRNIRANMKKVSYFFLLLRPDWGHHPPKLPCPLPLSQTKVCSTLWPDLALLCSTPIFSPFIPLWPCEQSFPSQLKPQWQPPPLPPHRHQDRTQSSQADKRSAFSVDKAQSAGSFLTSCGS